MINSTIIPAVKSGTHSIIKALNWADVQAGKAVDKVAQFCRWGNSFFFEEGSDKGDVFFFWSCLATMIIVGGGTCIFCLASLSIL